MKIRKLINTILRVAILTGGLGWNIPAQIQGDPSPLATGNQYLVEFKGDRIPDDLTERIAALGGHVIDLLPQMNVALIAGIRDAEAIALAAHSDVADVTQDDFLPRGQPARRVGRVAQPEPRTASVTDPTTAIVYPYQWNMRVVGADRAWAAGYLGSPDVRIAIIDTGIDPTNPDLADLIDTSRSASFCPEENSLIEQEFPGYPAWTDLDGHGTWVASIAASKGSITAGVTSRTTLMAVKWDGIVQCRGSSILRSILYSADNGADVINMSLARAIPWPKAGQKGFFHYFSLAVRYALKRSVSAVVVAAGNAAIDIDHDGNGYQLLCGTPGVICVSATGPTDSGPDFLGPFVNTDSPAFYTNFGASVIDAAAPGGNLSFDTSGNVIGLSVVWGACASTDRQFDAGENVVPGICSSGGYTDIGGIGTSAAAPHVSGLAALLASRIGHGRPAQIRSAIENSVDDLGTPGVDPFYGRGRLNVARALGIQ